MKLNSPTVQQSEWLKLPVIFTDGAWYEAVYVEQLADLAKLLDRWSELLKALYEAILYLPADNDPLTCSFGLYCFPPGGKRLDRHLLELRVVAEYEWAKPTALRVMLGHEAYLFEKRVPGEFFATGKLVATQGVSMLMKQGLLDISSYLGRHLIGDWGDLEVEDKQCNEHALRHELRLFSAYQIVAGEEKKLWIITESDRSVTTLLLPSEY